MTGFTLDSRQTSALADIVAACRDSSDGLPWEVLVRLKELLHAAEVSWNGFDTLVPHVWFAQCIAPDDSREVLVETPAEARDNPFWETYWTSSCSWPDRTGDFSSVVTLSDLEHLPDVRARLRDCGVEREVSMFAEPTTSGRHLRLLVWREPGSDFTDRDRFLLELLRPHLVQAFRSSTAADREPPRLTRRQLQVLRMVESGASNVQTARALEMSEGTVRTHLNTIYQRLGVQSRTAAVHAVFGSAV